eukprot:6490264-Amphidinium_carterae.7
MKPRQTCLFILPHRSSISDAIAQCALVVTRLSLSGARCSSNHLGVAMEAAVLQWRAKKIVHVDLLVSPISSATARGVVFQYTVLQRQHVIVMHLQGKPSSSKTRTKRLARRCSQLSARAGLLLQVASCNTHDNVESLSRRLGSTELLLATSTTSSSRNHGRGSFVCICCSKLPKAFSCWQSMTHLAVPNFPWDSVASQLFEPYGASSCDDLSLKQLWECANKGNKKALYHSHLCADDTKDLCQILWHVGAGIRITAATLLASIKTFRSDHMKALIKDDLYAKALEDVEHIEPNLKMLNLGKGSQNENRDTGSFRPAKKQRKADAGTDTVSEEQIVAAAHALHVWLSKPDAESPFRSMSFLLSGQNTFYSGHVAELVARAATQHKPLTKEVMGNVMRARFRKPVVEVSDQPAASSASGLIA